MNEKRNILYKISKYRSEIMGFSIIIVVLFHLNFNIDRFPLSLMNYPISIGGSIGVDLFFLVSGFGLYLSLLKDDNFISYIKKRLLRLLPAYYPIIAIYLIYYAIQGQTNLLDVISGFTLTSWWLDRGLQFNWYIQAIPFFYLLALPFASFLKRAKNPIITFSTLSLAMVLFNIPFMYTNKYQAFARFPIFIFGMMYGAYFAKNNYTVSRKIYITNLIAYLLCFGCYVASVLYLYRTNRFYTHIYEITIDYIYQLLVPILIWILCIIFDIVDKMTVGKVIDKLFVTIGEASLEIYLLHILVLWFVPQLSEKNNAMRLIIFVLFCGCGVIYHKLIAIIMKYLLKGF